MSTSLFAITNSRPYQMNEQTAQELLESLKTLPLARSYNWDGTLDLREWSIEYDYDNADDLSVKQICFVGGYALYPDVQHRLTAIGSIYRYALIYQNYALDWFQNFRKELYMVVQLLGGTEVFFLADNGNPLSAIYEGLVIEGIYSYNDIKQACINEFGLPVTDYSLLDCEKLEYESINEFFLDDFRDLKF